MTQKQFGDNDVTMAICGMRYCLGRQSYVTGICVEWLSDNWKRIPLMQQTIIIRDIAEALQDDAAGDPNIDVPAWRDFAAERFQAFDADTQEEVRQSVAHRNKAWPL